MYVFIPVQVQSKDLKTKTDSRKTASCDNTTSSGLHWFHGGIIHPSFILRIATNKGKSTTAVVLVALVFEQVVGLAAMASAAAVDLGVLCM